MDIKDLWNTVPVRPDICYGCHIGSLKLWIRYSQQDWYAASERTASERVPADLGSLGLREVDWGEKNWNRWIIDSASPDAQITPLMPDRPLVVKPEMPIRVPAGRVAQFFIGIPVWIRLSVGRPEAVPLLEQPAELLSNTWFGDPAAGELCYALLDPVARTFKHDGLLPWRVVCPVTVRNAAPGELVFQRLCLQVQYLSMYRGRDKLWSNGVQVTFRGLDQPGRLEVEKSAPKFEPIQEQINGPRETPQKSMIKTSFQFIKMLSGL